MALTCPNGHVNDEGNRFCEQCGAPLQQAPTNVAQPAAQPAAGSDVTSSTCPVCGQENVPGTAFCDNCGAALPPPLPATTGEPAAAEASAAPASAAAMSATTSAATIACPQCGTENDAANRFCDNCGANIGETSAATQAADDQAAAPADQPDLAAQAVGGSEAPAAAAPTPETTVPPTPAEATAPEASATAAPAVPESSIAAAATRVGDVAAERQRLEEVVQTQRQLIAQLEQMQANFGSATPPSTIQGLDEARLRLAQAETALQALPTQSTADPAEVARLEEVIRTQRQLVGQLEQMQGNFGAATPPSILQGLDEARQRLAQAESELQALTGGASTAPAAPAAETAAAQPSPAQPQQAAAPAAPEAPAPVTSQPAAPSQPVVSADQQPPAAQPQVSGPRFVTRDGSAISLPRTGAEIVIGRDDPISGIHPDVDLTPHGGEAGGVSRRHAILRETNGQWLLTDLDSTNYTRIDGNRITPDTPTPLHDGARVQFGRLEVDFRIS